MVTCRQARVYIVNLTSLDLQAHCVHLYSDNYKEEFSFGTVPAHGRSDRSASVSFNTGFGTTGRDWWRITVVAPDGAVYHSDPPNFRAALDLFEPGVAWAAAAVVGFVTNCPYAGVATQAALQGTGLLNGGKTAGFKQHILREEDIHGDVEIVIKGLQGAEQCEIRSKSGTSSTVMARLC